MEANNIMKEFIEQFHKREFNMYWDKSLVEECAENFEFFNKIFKPNEIKTVLEGVSSYEGLYRDGASNSCLSHGSIVYKPYYRNIKDTNRLNARNHYLEIYMFVISKQNSLNFYMKEIFKDDMEAESVRFDPYLYTEIKDCIFSDDKGIHINTEKYEKYLKDSKYAI